MGLKNNMQGVENQNLIFKLFAYCLKKKTEAQKLNF